MAAAEHLYLHVPFCGHRCGYCDFVTVTGNGELHGRYVDALIRELRGAPAPAGHDLHRRRHAVAARRRAAGAAAGRRCPRCDELTVECNPETITPAKARVLVEGGVTRVSLGAQSFQPHLLATLERRATPDRVVQAVETLRQAGVTNLNLDLMFGVPGQSATTSPPTSTRPRAFEPDHISYYELEAKPGTRFTHRHGAELERQAEALEDHYETVVATLRERGYHWYETANFCRDGPPGAPQPGLLGGARLPRPGRRRRLHDRPRAAPQPAVSARLPGGGGGGPGAPRRDRAAEPG